MKLGLAAGVIAGAVLVAGAPTVIYLATHDDGGHSHGRLAITHERFAAPAPGVQQHFRRSPSSGGRLQPGGGGTSGLPGQRLGQLLPYATWARCVLTAAASADGSFNPTKECGKAPAAPALPDLSQLPVAPPNMTR